VNTPKLYNTPFNIAVIAAGLGFFVDAFDLFLCGSHSALGDFAVFVPDTFIAFPKTQAIFPVVSTFFASADDTVFVKYDFNLGIFAKLYLV